MIPEQRRIGDEASGVLDKDIAPVRLLRRVARRDNNLEVGRAGVGANKEAIAVIHDLVVESRPARRDEPGRKGRMVEIDDQRLRGVVAMHRNDGGAAEARGFYADEPGRIVLHEHFDVVGLRGREPMQHDAAGAVTLILLDIEKRQRIAPSKQCLRSLRRRGRQGPSRARKVANRNGQHLGAEVVGAPGEFRMIRRMAPADEMKERLALGARVAVDEHRLRAAPAGLAAIDAALAAATKAGVIGPWPVDLRRLAVILLEARAHLALELFLQAERRRQNGVGIGVLGLEQRADVGRQLARIAQHLAPVLRPHPGVIVGPGKTVRGERSRPNFGARRRGRRGVRTRKDRLGSRACHGARAPRESARKAAGTSDGASQKAAAPAVRSSSAPP